MIRVLIGALMVLALVACGQPATNSLNNTSWQLVEVNGAGYDNQDTPVLKFGDKTLDGQGFCNTYSADYKAQGDTLSIAPVVATEMACEDVVFNILERDYFTALSSATHYTIQGTELQLLDADNTVVVLLRQK